MIKRTILFPSFVMVSFFLVLLSGCKIVAYHSLSEIEGNQMLSLLLSNNIDAQKETIGKTNLVDIMVEKSQIVTALNILTLNGFPKKKFVSVEEIFPSGQLITSPQQQEVKMIYAREQQLNSMLSQMPGVVSANVQINQNIDSSSYGVKDQLPMPSAAVLIIYAPQKKMQNDLIKIRSLVKNSVQGLSDDNLSIVMMPANEDIKTENKSSPEVDKNLSANILSLLNEKSDKNNQSERLGFKNSFWNNHKVLFTIACIFGLIIILAIGYMFLKRKKL